MSNMQWPKWQKQAQTCMWNKCWWNDKSIRNRCCSHVVVFHLWTYILPKYHLFKLSSLGLKTCALCPRTGLSLKTGDGLPQSRLSKTSSWSTGTQSIKYTIFMSLFFYIYKKTLTLSTSQTRIINILFKTMFPWTEGTPCPSSSIHSIL